MIRIIFNQTEREIAYCGKLISGYCGVNRRNDPRNGIWNDPIDSYCQHIAVFIQRWKITKPKTKHTVTSNANERKWSLRFQFHLVNESYGRQELG